MKVILLADVKKVGQKGSVVTVADGYAQNVLLPKKLATLATPENLKRIEKQREGAKERVAFSAELAKKALGDIDGKSVSIQVRANDVGTLFESIHPKQIGDAIAKQLNLVIPEDAITLGEPIKKIGEFHAHISVHGASAEIAVTVSKI